MIKLLKEFSIDAINYLTRKGGQADKGGRRAQRHGERTTTEEVSGNESVRVNL